MEEKPLEVKLRELLSEHPLLTEKDIDAVEHIVVSLCAARVVDEILPDIPVDENLAEVFRIIKLPEDQWMKESGFERE